MVKEEIDEVVKTMQVCNLRRCGIAEVWYCGKVEFLTKNAPQLFFLGCENRFRAAWQSNTGKRRRQICRNNGSILDDLTFYNYKKISMQQRAFSQNFMLTKEFCCKAGHASLRQGKPFHVNGYYISLRNRADDIAIFKR